MMVLETAVAFSRLLFHEGFSDGDRNLVIIGMDFRESEKPMAIAAIIYESGLQRGLNPSHLREIDISSELLP